MNGDHERMEKRPLAIRTLDVEMDCRAVVNQLVNSIQKNVYLRTSYVESQQGTGTETAQDVCVK